MNRILIILFSLVLASCDVSDKQYVRMLSWNKFSRFIPIPEERYPLSPLPKCDYALVTHPADRNTIILGFQVDHFDFDEYADEYEKKQSWGQTVSFNNDVIRELQCDLDNMERVKDCYPYVWMCLTIQIEGKIEKYYISEVYVVVHRTGCYKMPESLFAHLKQMGVMSQEAEYKIEHPSWLEKE